MVILAPSKHVLVVAYENSASKKREFGEKSPRFEIKPSKNPPSYLRFPCFQNSEILHFLGIKFETIDEAFSTHQTYFPICLNSSRFEYVNSFNINPSSLKSKLGFESKS